MAFTEVFDNTFPADTQQAKLLGDDIRKFKVDIQERMAAISGLDASKPAFDADTQPTKWNGLLFFATDTGKIYQFQSGTTWVDVTALFLSSISVLRYFGTLGTFAANGVGHAITIPANTLMVDKIARFTLSAGIGPFTSAGTIILVLKNPSASQNLRTFTVALAGFSTIEVEIHISSSTTANISIRVNSYGVSVSGGNADAGGFTSYTVDLTQDLKLLLVGGGSGTFTVTESQLSAIIT